MTPEDTTRTPSNSPDHLRTGIRWSTLFGLAAAALFFASIYISGTAAATSPTLGAAGSYSVLGGEAVTCTGATTTTEAVGVSPGTSITGFPDPCTAGGGTESNTASAIAAQADNLSLFGELDQGCDTSYAGVQDLAGLSLVPGVYCADVAFILTGNLMLEGEGVWIFKTATTLITSPGSSVSGGDPCDVWWRVGSSVTLDTNTSFIGNILARNGVNAMNNGADLNGRLLVQAAGTVTLDSNTITTPDCAVAPTSTATSTAVPGTATSTPTTPPGATSTPPAATSTPSNTPLPTARSSPSPGPTETSTATITPVSPGDSGQPPQAPVLLPPQAGDGGLIQTGGSGMAAAGIGLAAGALLAGTLALIVRSSRGQA
jgi:hypothetical protein